MAQERRRFWLVPQADLDVVCGDIEALGFAAAEKRIRQDQEMLASLNKEVETAKSLLVKARDERDAAKDFEAEAEKALRDATGTWDVCDKRIADLQRDLDDSEVADPSDEARVAAEESVVRAEVARDVAAGALRKADQLAAGLEPRVEAAREKFQDAEADLKDKVAQADPAVERWGRLRVRCEELGLLDAALGDPGLEDVAGEASIRVFELRQRWWAVMLDRLDRADDGSELAAFLKRLGRDAEAGSEQFLNAWLETRRWLALRVPKHVSEVDDPVDALRRLRRYLDGLVDKLKRFEHRLRGESNDVARAIESRLRKVSNLLNKLNRDLRGVGFGSIEAIQVKSDRDQRMSAILAALSSPDSQQDLYSADQPIEDALDDLFRRHGGRKRGGKRILDYRQYLRLRVEVRRRDSDQWEEARANQMSTGEAIGVGAAIMMVVLTAWERDASLLRPRRETGTLRFLFLDEATRLSLDNLEVLFDLCEALDLQLVIAAPEVATSKGNTTYLLQRGTDAEGREVVHVSGRRAIRSDG
ncbi:MAG: SbcC/MukB-like Walker B domain-containing protein [Acidobacteriota bacterium]